VRDLVERHGRTVLWATHRLEEVRDICDRVALIDRGRVRFQGTASEFMALAPGDGDLGSGRSLGALHEVFRRLIAEEAP
jgi:ABC-2 type transport system ATP-binding protein